MSKIKTIKDKYDYSLKMRMYHIRKLLEDNPKFAFKTSQIAQRYALTEMKTRFIMKSLEAQNLIRKLRFGSTILYCIEKKLPDKE